MHPTRTLGVIPARLASTRLPRKVLRTIAGRPMLAWVYEAARACPQLDDVVIATDSEEVARLCHQHGWPWVPTSPDLPSGTDRVHAVAQTHPAGLYVNIQGDEPLLRPEHLTALLRPFQLPHVEVTTLKTPCTPENLDNPNAVKVVTALDGPSPLLLPRHHSLRPRPDPPHRLQAPGPLRVPLRRAHPLPRPAARPARADRTPSNSYACSKTASPSTSNPPPTTPSGSTPRRTSSASKPSSLNALSQPRPTPENPR